MLSFDLSLTFTTKIHVKSGKVRLGSKVNSSKFYSPGAYCQIFIDSLPKSVVLEDIFIIKPDDKISF